MIRVENVDVCGWAAAIRGMRNPYASWDKSDSDFGDTTFCLGDDDLKLMRSLAKAGNDHAKFARMINVACDITAPLYWWKEFSTYKVGTVSNSCSTMYKIADKEFTLDDFSCEHLIDEAKEHLEGTIYMLNESREMYLNYDNISPHERDPQITCKKDIWWQMIQLLPSSYNQKRTIQLNYQVLWSMYKARKNHKLDEWKDFCKWIEELPYFKEIYLND